MKNFNFEEVSEQLRKEIVGLVNKKNQLRDVHAGLEADLRTVKELCSTYGSDALQSKVYMNVFNQLMQVETEMSTISKRITEYGALRDDVERVATRYNRLKNCGQCQLCATFGESDYDDMVMSLLEALFCSDFNGSVINCIRLTPPPRF